MTNFFTAQGASQLADELSKVVSKAQSLYRKQRLENAVQKKITDFFNSLTTMYRRKIFMLHQLLFAVELHYCTAFHNRVH